jgi:ribosomal protein S18 acetylase RimI-like enzyme
VEIRKLTGDDALQQYWPLRLRALREYPASFGEEYDDAAALPPERVSSRWQWVTSDDNFILGAFNPALVGTAALVRDEGSRKRHKAEVWSVYVAPETQVRGIARTLLQELIAIAHAIEGLEQLYLGVEVNNAPAIRLYQSLGFTRYATECHAMKLGDHYVDEHLMVLWLSDPHPASPEMGEGR